MSKYFIGVMAVLIVGCASSAPVSEKPTEYPSAPVVAAPSEAPKNEASEVLNKNKKCPRKSKLVNGKCTLQVETTE